MARQAKERPLDAIDVRAVDVLSLNELLELGREQPRVGVPVAARNLNGYTSLRRAQA